MNRGRGYIYGDESAQPPPLVHDNQKRRGKSPTLPAVSLPYSELAHYVTVKLLWHLFV